MYEETKAFDLERAMAELGLGIGDVVALTGKDRRTVWRWRKSGRCPAYVKTIIEQQKRIRLLASALAG